MNFSNILRLAKFLLIAAFLSSCAALGINQVAELNDLYGYPLVKERLVVSEAGKANLFLDDVKPILDNRCVVCHGCYDAACQLKLSSPAGIDRGASKQQIYESRLLTADPSRLFIDAETTNDWRKRDFYPVLNERTQSAEANLASSTLFQMLALKDQYPLPAGGDQILPAEHFEFGLSRDQQCPTIGEFPNYAKHSPFGGMPYALPRLDQDEMATLTDWLANGALMSNPASLSDEHQTAILQWEVFLNGDSFKQQLASRYIYEHLFLAHIHFDQLSGEIYYKILRSSTPPGEPISVIQSRLPYHDPGVERVYYRLWRDPATIVAKNHLPYAFNAERMRWYQSLFIDEPYSVTKMPNYHSGIASNPFIAFEDIPVRSRYRFMLEESRYTIMAFIKGPVCRGQVALNSIQDRFWVMFVDPENQNTPMIDEFLMQQERNLELPGSEEGYISLLESWSVYSAKNREYLMAKMHAMEALRPNDEPLTIDYIWEGDGDNKNAALTVFRHRDSASVVQGFVGGAPKTAWLINYPLLERIHYLLVAEFDVYGNIGHQLSTRLYMDFLRQEGEISFLTLLPKDERKKLYAFWYRDADSAMSHHMAESESMFDMISGIDLRSNDPQQELYQILRQHLAPILDNKYAIDNALSPPAHRELLQGIENLQGLQVQHFPEMALLSIDDANGQSYLYSILRNREHSNIKRLFSEDETHLPEEDNLTVVRGIIGDYPSAFWRVDSANLEHFAEAIANLEEDSDYAGFMTRFGIRRSHADFWAHSDKVLSIYAEMEPINWGLLDYNRLENR
ncbi:fatty acid cis/trans isomerase [Gammaproteobacteria bacterium]|nr:fatty acid cis/trans isomerase [Gammaproteobacteria bacterium]